MRACVDYVGRHRSRPLERLRMPGDVVFIVFGAVPLVIAAIKGSVARLRSVANIATD